MKPRTLLTAVALAALPALAAPASAATYSFAGDDVVIWNPAGEVRVEATSGSKVEVQVTTEGRDAGELEIRDEPMNGRPTLRVLYPTGRIVYPAMGRWSNTNSSIRRDGTWGDRSHGLGALERRISIKGSGSGTEAWADLVVKVPKGRKVSIHTLAGSGDLQGVDGVIRFDGGSGGARAAGCRGELVLDLGSGGVQVDDFDGESLDVDTGSGSIRGSGLRGRSVRLDTGSGGVTADGVTADDLLVDTGSGSVDLDGLAAKRAKVDTGSGNVTIALLTRTPDLEVDTGSGSVRVTVPEDLSAQLHFETGSGGIRSELPVTLNRHERGLLDGRIGGGEGRLRVDTGSGGVALLTGAPATKSRSRTSK